MKISRVFCSDPVPVMFSLEPENPEEAEILGRIEVCV